jgi:hypothetical protein
MDLKFKNDLKPGIRVAIFMGAAVADIYGTPPIVTTATVIEPPMDDDTVWLNMDIAKGETLPQRYKIDEIIGYMMPLVTVERQGNVAIAKLPEQP